MNYKRIALFLVGFVFVVSAALLSGCQTASTTSTTVASSNNLGTGTPPAGTTAVTLSGGNVSVSGSGLGFNLTAIDQNQAPISGIGGGNIKAEIFAGSNPGAGDTPVATLTLTSFTGGSASNSKNVSAALVLDKSGSMYDYTGKVYTLEAAARLFVTTAASFSTSNKVAVINFDDTVQVSAPMTLVSNATSLDAAINKDLYEGSTALYDGIGQGILQASSEAPSATLVRAVIAMTDGGENASFTYTNTGEVIALANASNIPVYTVGVYASTSEAASLRGPLVAIAQATTGSASNYFEVISGVTVLGATSASASQIKALGTLTTLYQNLATALAQSYSIQGTLSTALSAAHTYTLKITLQSYGSFTGQIILVPFTTI